MKDKYLKELEVFKDFTFYEFDHHYEYKGERVGISVTRLIEEYTQPFNAEEVASKVVEKNLKLKQQAEQFLKDYIPSAKYANDYVLEEAENNLKLPTTINEILNEWKVKNEQSLLKGTISHENVQNMFAGINYQPNIKSCSEATLDALELIFKQEKNFYNDFRDKFELVANEYVIGSKDNEFDIASAVDGLFVNKLTGGLVMVDYKTNTDIYKDKKYYENAKRKIPKMKVPLDNLEDLVINHYAIQLSIYKFLIEKYTKIKLEDMFIVWFSEANDNYQIIEVPYLKKEVEKILRDRRERIMGKCMPILIIGKSGSGKSTSLRNLSKDDYSLVNVLNKDLPFKNGRNIQGLSTKNYELVKEFIKKTPKNIIVIDDFGYIMTDSFVQKATETGYTKFSVIAKEFYNFIEFIKELDGDKRVYLMMHEEKSDDGDIAPKTCGKMLDNQICVEGLFSILLRCVFDGKEHKFKTMTDGLDVCKTPMGMFDSEFIDNDLKLVDDKICEYYEINKESKKKEEKK